MRTAADWLAVSCRLMEKLAECNVAGEPPYRGQLVHHGWQATRCELPQWSGNDAAAMIVEPVELELA